MLSILRLYNVNDRMINECGADGEMRTGRGNRSTQRRVHDLSMLNFFDTTSKFSTTAMIVIADL
jgi:hypothetical protein